MPKGQPILGAVNVDLTARLHEWAGRSIVDAGNHGEVHDWYHWTIDLSDSQGRTPYFDAALGQQRILLNRDRPLLDDEVVAGRADFALTKTYSQAENVGFRWSLAPTFPSMADGFAYPDTFNQAAIVDLASGSVSKSSQIETNGDSDLFKFMAPRNGTLTITQRAGSGNTLDSRLSLYDASQKEIVPSANTNGSRGAETIHYPVAEGQTSYVRAGAFWSLNVVDRIGAYRLDFSLPVPQMPVPDITVRQSSRNLTSGAAAVEFGSVAQGDSDPTRTFTVRNDGAATLSLTGISVPAGFVVTEGLNSSLAPGGSDTLTVSMDTATIGSKSGEIAITSNDSDETPFRISIRGSVAATVVAAPSISVFQGATKIIPGTTPPMDFGEIEQGQSVPNRLFTIANEGTASLTLGSIELPSGYILTGTLNDTLALGTIERNPGFRRR